MDALVRGVYAKCDLEVGHVLGVDDVYLAIPLHKGQISCRELRFGEILSQRLAKDAPIMLKSIKHTFEPEVCKLIEQRGL